MKLANYWHTTAFRLVIIYGSMFLATVMLLMGLVYWRTVGYLSRQMEYSIEMRMHQLYGLDDADLRNAVNGMVYRDVLHQSVYGYFGPRGHWRAGNLDALPPVLKNHKHLVEGYYALRNDYDEAGIQTFHEAIFLAEHTPDGGVLVVGRNVTAFKHFRWIIEEALLEAGTLVVVLGLGVSLMLSLSSIRRVRFLTQRCNRIAQGVFSERLEVSERQDELDMLASTVNVMLDRVEQLMEEVRNVCNNIAHDLRTPMTRLRSRLHRLRFTLDEQYGDDLQGLLEDTDEVLGRFRALLRIAELESHKRRSAFTEISLNELLERLIEFYGPLSEEKSVSFSVRIDRDCRVQADDELLFEATANILDNAIKFSPPQSLVHIHLYVDSGRPVLDILDQGPGIPEHEREAVMKRYYRGTGSASMEGQGLGLSIVMAIMNLHGFEFSFEPTSLGALARVRFTPFKHQD